MNFEIGNLCKVPKYYLLIFSQANYFARFVEFSLKEADEKGYNKIYTFRALLDNWNLPSTTPYWKYHWSHFLPTDILSAMDRLQHSDPGDIFMIVDYEYLPKIDCFLFHALFKDKKGWILVGKKTTPYEILIQ